MKVLEKCEEKSEGYMEEAVPVMLMVKCVSKHDFEPKWKY